MKDESSPRQEGTSGPYRRKNTVRIRFADPDRPILRFEDRSYPIVEFTKTALRFIDLQEPRLSVQTGLHGRVAYPHGKSFPIEGVVESHQDEESILRFFVSLTTGRINRRDRFRVRYPLAEQVDFRADGMIHTVSEIAEGGIRLVRCGQGYEEGHPLEGHLELHGGERIWVSGRVLRAEAEDYVIVLDKGIPLTKVMGEQLFLLRKYPM